MKSMNILIPAAGKSSRYKSLKPKYLLTHPSGLLMIEIVLMSILKRITNCHFYIVILREHDDKFGVSNILNQIAQSHNLTLTVTILENLTSGPAETVYECIKQNDIEGSFLIKDSDNVIDFDSKIIKFEGVDGFLVGGDVSAHDIVDIHQKSFIVADHDNKISNFVEKRIVSNIVCFGLYGFTDTQFYIKYYDLISKKGFNGELFVSHIVQTALLDGRIFSYREALSLSDWGIWGQWMLERKRLRTFFIDFDGVVVFNTGQYGDENWDSNFRPITENVSILKALSDSGAQIILTTSRPEKYQMKIDNFFKNYGIKIFSYVFGLHHSERVLINDYSDSNPFPSASALNLMRDGNLQTFIDVLQ